MIEYQCAFAHIARDCISHSHWCVTCKLVSHLFLLVAQSSISDKRTSVGPVGDVDEITIISSKSAWTRKERRNDQQSLFA